MTPATFVWGLLKAIAEDVYRALRKKAKPLPPAVKTRNIGRFTVIKKDGTVDHE